MVPLDPFLPTYHAREVHATTIRATPERILRIAKTLTPLDVPGFRFLTGLRGWPARLVGRRAVPFAGTRPLFEQALRAGFVVLADVPNEEFVLGWIGQFWKLWGGLTPRLASVQDFVAFNRGGFAKAAISFRVEPRARGLVTLQTETRVRALDPVAQRRLTTYWWLIRPGSGLIRRMWLRAIKDHAENPPHLQVPYPSTGPNDRPTPTS
jgi:hypothetical protein